MKTLITTLCLLFLAIPCMAADVNLGWDASTSMVDGYALFDRNFQKPYNYDAPSWTGSTLTATVTVTGDRQSAFVARAFVYGPYDLQGNRTQIWSDNSNEVIYPGVTPPKPTPPRNFIVKILVAILGFFGRLLG